MLVTNVTVSNKLDEFYAPPAGSNSFVFKITEECTTSAGVYTKSKQLIRTLWSGKKYKTGVFTEQWDGKDDEGNPAPGGNYEITVLSNNMQYEWEGVIGNTSGSFTGDHVYHNNMGFLGMAVSGQYAYVAVGYNEQKAAQQKFDIQKPQERINMFSKTLGQISWFVAADNKIVYWAGLNNNSQWFVFGTTVSDDKEVAFSAGVQVKPKFGKTYNAISFLPDKGVPITGMAVQQKGKYLFLSCQNKNMVAVIDKETGNLIKSVTLPSPGCLSVDGDDNIWLAHNNTIEKFSVSGDGSLNTLHIRINGITEAKAIAVSNDNHYVLVTDGGSSQQVKAFDSKTGGAKWIYGEKGGYQVSARVANDKFFFANARTKNTGNFICFDHSGSFWVNDPGNYRIQRFAPDRSFIQSVMYIPGFYSGCVDKNNPERVFADFLEFSVDYTKPLAPDNGSWNLAYNWGAVIPDEFNAIFFCISCVATLKNGRTYAFLFSKKKQKKILAELVPGSIIKITGREFPVNAMLYGDGSVYSTSAARPGKPVVWTIQELRGFNENKEPEWNDEKIIASSPPVKATDPVYRSLPSTLRPGEITDSGVLVSFDASRQNNGWHLGGIQTGTDAWLWKTAKSTSLDYKGEFPPTGDFDIGNGVKYAGAVAIVLDNHIFQGYHGEFWKSSQTNKWNHFYHNGLFINQFGTTGPEVKMLNQQSPPQMAGNVYAASVIKLKDGRAYLYHNDENYHGGIHRWRIRGFDTVQEQHISLSLSSHRNGLTGIYFNNREIDNSRILSAVVDSEIQFASISRNAVQWKGKISSVYSEDHNLIIDTDGGVRFWLNGVMLADDWNNDSQKQIVSRVFLDSTKAAELCIELSNASNISLSWQSKNQVKQTLPRKCLSPVATGFEAGAFRLPG